MANQKTSVKKKTNPSFEANKEQAATYEAYRQKMASQDELTNAANDREEARSQPKTYEQFKSRLNPYQEEVPYSSTIDDLRETVQMLASNKDYTAMAQCISGIAYFENEQVKIMTGIKKEGQKTPVYLSDNQSILQTSSVRKKDKEALAIIKPAPVN